MFLTKSFYPAPVNTLSDPPSRVHSQFCENVPEESCTLMEEGEHTSHYTTDVVPPSRTIVTTFDINHEINISACQLWFHLK
jgi:hypothetical protein